MKPEEIELVRYRMARAKESIEEARLLLAGGHLHTAANRIYYACFYAVSALLFTERLSSPKHSGVRALFDQHWIKTGRLPKHLGRSYRRFFDMRQKGDYADLVVFDAEEIRDWLNEATAFVEEIAKKVDERIAGER